MSVEQIEATITSLSPSEQREFILWVDNHRHELLRDVETAQQAEVLSRLAETDANPERLEPFEEADMERMFQEIADAHAQKTSARKG